MATNILPLLLLGGGAAYLIHKKQKEKTCPPRIKVDRAKIAPEAAQRVSGILKKYMDGEAVDPSQAADEMFALLAPLECKNTDSIIEADGESVVAKDLYAQLLAQFTAGEQIFEILKSFSKDDKCPTAVAVDPKRLPEVQQIMGSIGVGEVEDPDKVADSVFKLILPLRCKWSTSTIVSIQAVGIKAPAPDVFGAILADILEEYRDKEIMSQDDAVFYFDQFKAEFQDKTSREWKDPVGAN